VSEEKFIGYIQEPDLHDRLFAIRFSRVRSANIKNVDGMRLYALSEMQATPPLRKFVFADWEEESDRYCEVVAREIMSTELTEDFVPKEAIAHLRNTFPR